MTVPKRKPVAKPKYLNRFISLILIRNDFSQYKIQHINADNCYTTIDISYMIHMFGKDFFVAAKKNHKLAEAN